MDSLKKLLGAGTPVRGVVVEVRDNSTLVATPSGLREFNSVAGITAADQVTIHGDTLRKSASPKYTYWV